MKYLLILLFPTLVQAKTLRIAVIDGGFDPSITKEVTLCPDTKIYQTNTTFPVHMDHGTRMTKIIKKFTDNRKHCFILIQGFYPDSSFEVSRNAFKLALELKADVINYSGGGTDIDWLEKNFILQFLNKGGIMFAAAGNNARDLNLVCNYFPACYDKRIIMVGNNQYYSNKHTRMLKVDVDNYDFVHGTSGTTALSTGLYVRLKGDR